MHKRVTLERSCRSAKETGFLKDGTKAAFSSNTAPGSSWCADCSDWSNSKICRRNYLGNDPSEGG